MKVTIFSQFYPPEMEPSGFMFHSLAKHLGKSSSVEQVDVICGFPNFPTGKFLNNKWLKLFTSNKNEGVNIHNVIVVPSNNKSNIKRIVNYTSYLITSFLKGIFMPRPDVIVATSPPIFAALSGLLIAKVKSCSFVLDVRDIWPESAVQMGSIKSKLIISLLEYLELSLYRNAQLITVATPGMVDIVRSKIPDLDVPIEYVPCGVEIPDLQLMKRHVNNPFPTGDHDKFCVLYAGLHGHAQNLTTIVDAAYILRERSDIKFYFVGTGPDKERIVNYAEELKLNNIVFVDPVERDTIRQFFLSAGCALVPLQDLPIFKNVFPSKTFELMSYGVPTVVGVGGEIEKLLNSTGSGVAVAPEAPEEYAKAIVKYAESPEFREEVALKAIKTSEELFNYSVLNCKLEKMLMKLK